MGLGTSWRPGDTRVERGPSRPVAVGHTPIGVSVVERDGELRIGYRWLSVTNLLGALVLVSYGLAEGLAGPLLAPEGLPQVRQGVCLLLTLVGAGLFAWSLLNHTELRVTSTELIVTKRGLGSSQRRFPRSSLRELRVDARTTETGVGSRAIDILVLRTADGKRTELMPGDADHLEGIAKLLNARLAGA